MPKNLKGGKGAKSQKNSSGPSKAREIAVPNDENNANIAIITKIFGGSRYLCQILDSNGLQPTQIKTRIQDGIKRKFGRGIPIVVGTHVLIEMSPFGNSDDHSYVIFIYKDIELSHLIKNDYMVKININNTEIKNDSNLADTGININDDKEDLFNFSEI